MVTTPEDLSSCRAQALTSSGFLLSEDAERYVEAAKGRDPFDESIPLRPLVLSKAVPALNL